MRHDSKVLGFSFYGEHPKTYKLQVNYHLELLPVEMIVHLSHQWEDDSKLFMTLH